MGLADYEKSEPTLRNYFPDLIRAIDVKTEQTRVAATKFAPAQEAAQGSEQGKDLSGEVVAKNRQHVATLTDDPEAIEALTMGEKQLSAKNPRAAEASFKSVLAKYPNQPRAWYGLGMVAVLDHDAERAKEVFGRLTAGQYAASQDPLVMSWSHIYLARIFADEGQLDRAKSEYQAVLNVEGAPPQAQQAAQKGLGDLDTRKPSERP
jgi:tetratricopeptide (TPR) repeat protein